MATLNLVSFIFLVVLFVLTPRAALRSARMLRRSSAAGLALPRTRIVLSTMFAMTVLWVLSVINATWMRRNLYAPGPLGPREIGFGCIALALLLTAIPISRAMHSPEEERRRLLYGIAPRNGREFVLFALVAMMAGVAEESAYRGVSVWILAPVMGNVVPAMLLSAAAFAVAHAVQGGKTMAMVFSIALVFHALVYLTNTLVIAMVVHVVYDIIAGYVAGERAKELLASGPADGAALSLARTASPAVPRGPGRNAD